MKKLLSALTLVFPNIILAAGEVTYLEVQENIVYFSTSASKTVTVPACSASDKSEIWSVSLSDSSGRAMYSMILTAMSSEGKFGLEVVSAGDCAHDDDVERAKGVNIVSINQTPLENDTSEQSSNNGGLLGVYKGDLSERIGTFLELKDNDPNSWYYVEDSERPSIKNLTPLVTSPVMFFESTDCTGNEMWLSTGSVGNGEFFVSNFDNQFIKKVDVPASWNNAIKSQLRPTGECRSSTGSNTQKFSIAEHETCGTQLCILKRD